MCEQVIVTYLTRKYTAMPYALAWLIHQRNKKDPSRQLARYFSASSRDIRP